MPIGPLRGPLVTAIFAAWIALCVSAPVHAKQAGGHAASVQAIVAAALEADKCRVFMKMRQSLTASTVLSLLRSEPSPSVTAMAVGVYLEKSEVQPRDAAEILLTLAQRTGYGQAATFGAASGKGAAIADELAGMSSRVKTLSPPLLGAEILAAYATMASEGIAAAGGRHKRRQGGRDASFTQDTAAVAASLARLLKSKEPEVVEAAILAAARLRLKQFQQTIEAQADVRSPSVTAARMLYLAKIGAAVPDALVQQVFAPPAAKAAARRSEKPALLLAYGMRTPPLTYGCQALGEMHDAKYIELLHRALNDPDYRVQIDAAQAIEMIGAEASVPALLRKVEETSLPWPVLVYVLSAVGAIPSKDSVPVLIDRLAGEKGRFRLDVNYALASIAGKQCAANAPTWRSWWEANQAAFTVDKARTAKFREAKEVQDMQVFALGRFYSLNLVSDRIVFTIDTSNSMQGKKIESAKENLIAALESLQPHVQFDVVDFGGILGIMRTGSLMTKSDIGSAVQRVGYMTHSLGTRAYDAMELGMTVPGMDTIVLLSDGAPVAGKFEAWPRLIGALGILTRYYPVAIWGLQFSAGAANFAAMEELCNRNWGRAGSPEP